MKNGPLLFLGLFAAMGISWGALALGTNAQLGGLAPYFDRGEESSYPYRAPGIASRGQLIYQDLGCAACHTQAVRRPGYGNDEDRGWGKRQSVARDYIHLERVQLGQMRNGPDLTNYGARLEQAEKDVTKREQAVFKLLYEGTHTMPAYKFLFEERSGEFQKSPFVVGQKDGLDLAPNARARELVSYLISLKTSYDYPEAKPFKPAGEAGHAAEAKKEGGHE